MISQSSGGGSGFVGYGIIEKESSVRLNVMGRAIFILALTIAIILTSFQLCSAQVRVPKGDPVVIQVIQLDYADAENLVTLLTPLLSPEGRMVADSRTNCLIIKDRTSVVRGLVEIIKGSIDP